MAATVGISGCQTVGLPGNPFPGKLPLSKIPVPRLPVPKLPSFAKISRPNLGNIARTIATPAQQATNRNTSIASKKNQPPPPPSRKFDSSDTDEKLALAPQYKPNTVTPDFTGGSDNTNSALTAAQKRFKDAITSRQKPSSDFTAKRTSEGGLWDDYQPDFSPSASNTAPAQTIEELAQVNRNLYDQYGKLTTGKPSPKVSAPFDSELFATKPTNADIEETNESVAGLRAQLEKLKARGARTSTEISPQARSAVEPIVSAPLVPIKKQLEAPIYKGFGQKIQFGPNNDFVNQGTVRIPAPTAPANVLRASATEILGLAQTTQNGGQGNYSATKLDGYASDKVDPLKLPTGSRLAQSGNDLVANQFVQTMSQKEIPALVATAKPKQFEMPLPRKVSDASLAAIAENARLSTQQPQPKVTFQNPVALPPVKMLQPAAIQVVTTAPVAPKPPVATSLTVAQTSAFQLPSNDSPRTTQNQFFQRPAIAATSAAAVNAAAKPAERGVELQEQEFPPTRILQQPEPAATALPAGLVTGDGTYAPGSVIKPQQEELWR